MKYALLMFWVLCDLIRDIFFVGGAMWLIVTKHYSGWWLVLAIALCVNISLFKALKKVFNVE